MAVSNPFTITISAAPTTQLEALAASLAPGQSVSVMNGDAVEDGIGAHTDNAHVRQTIQWGNRFFYDHGLKKAFLYGKDASAGSGTAHTTFSEYDAHTDTWVTSGRFHQDGAVETGHLYESIAWDFVNKRMYRGKWSSQPSSIRYWDHGSPLTQWGNTSVGFAFSNTNAVNPALGWHPNLFGLGDDGLLAHYLVSGNGVRLAAWRRATNSWSVIGSSGSPWVANQQHGCTIWCRALNGTISTFSSGGNTFFLGTGSNGVPATPVQIANPPLPCRYDGGPGSNVGVLIDDPLGTGGPYVLEKNGSNRVWRLEGYESGVANAVWALKVGVTHPFPWGAPAMNSQWYTCSVYPLGIFWTITQTGTPMRMFWKPNG